MKVLKGRMHTIFEDLEPGETYISDGKPHIKVGGSAGSNPEMVLAKIKEDMNYLNSLDLRTGIIYHVPGNEGVSKVELGITGMEDLDA